MVSNFLILLKLWKQKQQGSNDHDALAWLSASSLLTSSLPDWHSGVRHYASHRELARLDSPKSCVGCGDGPSNSQKTLQPLPAIYGPNPTECPAFDSEQLSP